MNTVAAIDLVLSLLMQAQKISQMVAQAQSEGREISSEEWAKILGDDDSARQALVDAIKRHEH